MAQRDDDDDLVDALPGRERQRQLRRAKAQLVSARFRRVIPARGAVATPPARQPPAVRRSA